MGFHVPGLCREGARPTPGAAGRVRTGDENPAQPPARALVAAALLLAAAYAAFFVAGDPALGGRRRRRFALPRRPGAGCGATSRCWRTRSARATPLIPKAWPRRPTTWRPSWRRPAPRSRARNSRCAAPSYRNVIARVGPAVGPLVVVGAHYDAMGEFGPNPGADDNASGAAGLVELARLLAARPAAAAGRAGGLRQRGAALLRLAQHGQRGARRTLRAAGRRPEAMICFEMIGYFTAKQPGRPGCWPASISPKVTSLMLAGRFADRHLAAKVKAGFSARRDLPRRIPGPDP